MAEQVVKNTAVCELSRREIMLQALEQSMAEKQSLALFTRGMKLFASQRKLFIKYVLGVIICLMISGALVFIFHGLFQMFLAGQMESMFQAQINWPSWLSWMATPERWVRSAAEVLMLIVSYLMILYVSVRLSFLFMIYWTDEMVAMVMKLNRDREDFPLSAGRMARLLKVGLRFTLRTVGVTLLFFMLSWIPFIGYPIFLIGAAWSSGKDIISTVVMVYAEEDMTIPEMVNIPFRNSVKMGWLHSLIYSIPLFGFLLLPVLYMTQVCAFTLEVEERMRAIATGEAPQEA